MALVLLVGLLGGAVWGASALAAVASNWAGDLFADAEPGKGPPAEDEETLPPRPDRCAPGDLDVAMAPRAGSGATDFALTIVNDSETPCLVDAGAASLVLTVHSGDDRIWSTGDCSAGAAEHMLLLAGGDTTEHTVTWSGQRSEPGCPSGQPAAEPGTYRVATTLDGARLPTAEASFTL
ncbi:hypothetical protein GCM10023169_08150 [Georgenia halophila]|uniref:DUF4232 domain-containing protein n=1 Tax=Georgenia halophila TaxID=620889 RepID=A0ABP8KY70_9MICO